MKTRSAARSTPNLSDAFAYRVLPMAVAACFALPAHALPTGPAVGAGNATFATQGNTLTVTSAPGTVINWQQFSIRPDEITRFVQSGAMSAVLNRVTGGEASQLLGQLLSNGRVFLINPAGITIGGGAVIDTAGFVASSLNISDADFLAGRMKFATVGAAGAVQNHGTIHGHGGPIYLIAPTVENHGVIRSDNGDILLAAGKRVEVVAGASPHLRVEIDNAAGTEALNVGELVGRHVSVYASALRNSGTVSADRVSVTDTGSIVLYAAKDATLGATSRVTVNGAAGGQVEVRAAGGTLLVDGVVEARGTAGQGGDVKLLGDRVGVVGNAAVDASGAAGGGSILVGGDYQGANAAVQNAARTYVAPDATIRADATASGDGGRAIVWADEATRFYGRATARGGDAGGDGGLIEVSGKQYLDFSGSADTRAPHGATGLLLLDPSNVNITTTADALAGGAFAGGQFGGAAGTATLTWSTIDAQLASNNVVITTSGSGGAGNVTVVNASPVLNRANDLWLVANNAITVNGAITNAGAGGLRLYAGWNGAAFAYPTVPTLTASTTADIAVNQAISMAGAIVMAASDSITVSRDVITSGANRAITLRADADNNAAGTLLIQSSAGANTAAVTTTDGAITLSGFNVNVRGGAAAGRNAIVSAGGTDGTLDLRARQDLIIDGGAAGTTSTVQSQAAQVIAAGRDTTVAGGTSANATATLQVTADAGQTIDVGRDLIVRGSNTANANNAKGMVAGRGAQSIDVGRNFTIAGGTAAGTNKHGVVTNAPGGGSGATDIRVVGNFTETNPAGGTNRAWLGGDGTGAFGDVSASVSTGGSIALTSSLSVAGTADFALTGDAAFAAGALWGANTFFTGSAASAAVAANGAGDVAITAPVGPTTVQTANGAIALTGVNISATGGAAAGRNVLVDAQGAGGTLAVTARGNLTITGGSAAGVTAAMQSAGAQSVAAGGALTVAGGNANNATALLGLTADATQTIDVGGTLTVRGGTGAAVSGSTAGIVGRGTQLIDANAITIAGGAAGTGNSARIDNQPGSGSGATTMRAINTITQTNAAGGRAYIGDATGTLGDVGVSLQAGGNIAITSGLTVGGTAGIEMTADAAFAAGALWGPNTFFPGSAQSVAVASNAAGNIAFTAPVGATTVQTRNGSIALAGVDITATGGAAAGRNVLLSAQGANGTLAVKARRDFLVTGGTAAGVTAAVQSSAAQSIAAGRDLTVAAGTAANATAAVQLTADAAQTIDVARNLTVRGSNTANANNARGVIAGRGTQSIDVGGNFAVAGGTGAGTGKNGVVTNTPGAGAGSTTVRVLGNVTETNASAANRAWLGTDGSGVFTNVGVDLRATGDISLASALATNGGNAITIRADEAFAAGDLWAADRFAAGSAASAAAVANNRGGVILASGAAASSIGLTTASGAITVVSAARNAANTADVDATLGTAANQLALSTGSGDIAVGNTATSGAGNNSFRNVTVANSVATTGTLTLEANNTLTVNATVSGDAGVTLLADADATAGGLLTLNAAVTTTTGNVLLSGTGVTQTALSAVNAGTGTLTVDGNDGAITLAGLLVTANPTAAAVRVIDAATATLGNVSAVAGALTVGEPGTDAINGAVTQTAGTTVIADMVTATAGGAVTLGNANQIVRLGPITAGGSITVNDVAGGLDVIGAQDVTAAAGASIAITTAGGPLSIQNNVVGNATTTAIALTGTGVTQTAGTFVSAGGATVLVDANDGAVALLGQVDTANATTNAVRVLDASSAVLGTINATSGTVTLGGAGPDAIGGAVSQTAGSAIAANALVVNVAGNVMLANGLNDFGTATAAVAGGGALDLFDANALTVGPVSADGDVLVRTATGGGNDIALTGNVVSNNGDVTLASGDDIHYGVFGPIAPNGRWLTYSYSPATNTGTIPTPGNAKPNIYNSTYAALGPGVTLPGGNHNIYAYQPVLLYTADAATRVYGDPNPALGGSVGPLVNGDTAADAYSGTAVWTTTAIATSAVGNYAITGSGLTSDIGYGFAQAPANATALGITPAALTVTADDQTKSYGQTFVFAGTEFATAGLKNGETIGSVTLASAGAAATAGVAGSPYAITASGAAGGTFTAGNYTISYVDGLLAVTPAALTVTASDQLKVYGDTLVFGGTEFAALGLQNGETIGSVTLASAGAAPTATVAGGPYSINAAAASGGTFNPANYTVTYADGTLTVTPRPMTVTADNQTKVYGTPDPALTYVAAGLVNGDALAGALTRAPGETVPGGPYAITQGTVTDAANPNYAIAFTIGALTITPAALLITANDAARLYGDPNPVFGATFAGLANGDTPGSIAGLAFATPATVASNVGSYAIMPLGVVDPNYTIAFANGTLAITPAPLVVTADDTARLFGLPNPPFTASSTGFRLGQTVADLTGALAFTTSAGPESLPGTYAITPSGVSSLNYAVTFVNGTLVVTPAAPPAETARDVAVTRATQAAGVGAVGGGVCAPAQAGSDRRMLAPGLCLDQAARR